MRWLIEHRTEYSFTSPVFLEPHLIRLTPRQDPTQRILSFDLSLDPEPGGRWQGTDQDGNPFVQAWFEGLHDRLRIDTRTEAVTLRSNPFGFLLDPKAQSVPPALDASVQRSLAACLDRIPDPSSSADGPATLAAELVRESKENSLDFLTLLNTRLFERLEKITRFEQGILSPGETLASGRGACRDLALLFMDCCRSVGIPSRFVSGYQAGDTETPETTRDLHAWSEAFLPGAGWVGFDPTHGLVVSDKHLALAASHDPALTMPLEGTFRGTGVTAALRHEIQMRISD